MKWLTVARAETIQPGQMLRLEIGRRAVALANVAGEFFAFNDTCPHQDYSLSDGILENCKITCAMHGWAFDLRDGSPYPPLLRPYLIRYPVKLEDGNLLISLE